MALVEVSNVSLGYEGKVVASEISFSIQAGEYLCVVGENGSGKSTLMKTMLGLMPAVSGKIQFGEGLTQSEIGYLPQQTEVQRDFPASAMEIVLSGCLNHCGMRPFFNRADKETAARQMERLGISDLAKRSYRELSGGQQQRVLLARALCATQKILLLDEPAAGLDPKAATDMYQIIEDLNRENGIAIVMISHDIGAAMDYASHILHVGNTPLFYGPKADYPAPGSDRKFLVESRGGAQ